MAKIKRLNSELITKDFELLSISYVIWNEFKDKPNFHVDIGYAPGVKRDKARDNMWKMLGIREDSKEISNKIAKNLQLQKHPNLSSSWTITPEEFEKLTDRCEKNGFTKSYYNDTERRNPQYHTYLTIDCNINTLENVIDIICS